MIFIIYIDIYIILSYIGIYIQRSDFFFYVFKKEIFEKNECRIIGKNGNFEKSKKKVIILEI